nr:MAG TPA: hypothetical protein [Caudoviricetes sp.]
MPVWLVVILAILASLATLAGLPFLFVFFEVVGAWYDSLFDRLEAVAERFCQERGWF